MFGNCEFLRVDVKQTVVGQKSSKSQQVSRNLTFLSTCLLHFRTERGAEDNTVTVLLYCWNKVDDKDMKILAQEMDSVRTKLTKTEPSAEETVLFLQALKDWRQVILTR